MTYLTVIATFAVVLQAVRLAVAIMDFRRRWVPCKTKPLAPTPGAPKEKQHHQLLRSLTPPYDGKKFYAG